MCIGVHVGWAKKGILADTSYYFAGKSYCNFIYWNFILKFYKSRRIIKEGGTDIMVNVLKGVLIEW